MPLFIKAHKLELLQGHFPCDSGMIGSGEGADRGILKDGHLSKGFDDLEGPGNAEMADVVRFKADDLFSIESDRTLLRGKETRDRIEEGGLSCAVWADQAQESRPFLFQK